jgi:hypothetical protein
LVTAGASASAAPVLSRGLRDAARSAWSVWWAPGWGDALPRV